MGSDEGLPSASLPGAICISKVPRGTIGELRNTVAGPPMN